VVNPDFILQLLFGLLALIFLLLGARPRKRNGHPARRAHLRIGFIFAAIAIFLLLRGRQR
jgi:hypothetical protein